MQRPDAEVESVQDDVTREENSHEDKPDGIQGRHASIEERLGEEKVHARGSCGISEGAKGWDSPGCSSCSGP